MVRMVFSSGVFAEALGLLPRISTPLPIAQRKHANLRFTCRHELPFCSGVFFLFMIFIGDLDIQNAGSV